MQSGYCVKGNECTFAHGYDDLRLMKKSSKEEEDAGEQHGGEKGHDIDQKDDIKLTPEQQRARAATARVLAGDVQGAADKEVLERKANPYADDADEIDRDGGDGGGSVAA